MVAKIKTYKKTFSSANILSIEVGTNTPCGGDAGHGGVTVFKLRNEGGTAWELRCNGIKKEDPEEITIELYGDTEADTFIQALEYALSILKSQRMLKMKAGS